MKRAPRLKSWDVGRFTRPGRRLTTFKKIGAQVSRIEEAHLGASREKLTIKFHPGSAGPALMHGVDGIREKWFKFTAAVLFNRPVPVDFTATQSSKRCFNGVAVGLPNRTKEIVIFSANFKYPGC